MRLVSAYITSAVVFLALDLIWLGYVASESYRSQMGHLMAPAFNVTAAAAFYILFLAGVLIFVIQPALLEGGVARAAVMGALFGFFTYMTYDLTALAVIRDFPSKLAVVDIVWGSVLTAIAAAAGTAVGSRF